MNFNLDMDHKKSNPIEIHDFFTGSEFGYDLGLRN